VLADGTLRSKGASIDKTKQTEIGLKYRTKELLPGSLGLFATAFTAETAEKNYEATTQRFTDRVYKANGIELESAYHYQGFDLRFSATMTDAEISRDLITPALEGNTPRRQAKFIYQVTPSYSWRKLSIGASAIGTSRFYLQDNNDLVQPGYMYLNGFASYELARGLVLSINVNNLTNAYGLSEAEEGSMPSNGVLRGRGITGRTSSVTLKYSF
jgi:outer membrane receptor protein involved in Fe transport